MSSQKQRYFWKSELPYEVVREVEFRLKYAAMFDTIEWNFNGVTARATRFRFPMGASGTIYEVWYRKLGDKTASIEIMKSYVEGE